MENNIYVVTAYRFGNREGHSYVVGVSIDKNKALLIADNEEDRRGRNKYHCEILEFDLLGNKKVIKSIDVY